MLVLSGEGGGEEGCGREGSGCVNIVGGGEWEPFTSSAQDDDGDDSDVAESDEDVARVAAAPGALGGGAGTSNLEEEDAVHEGGDVDLKAPEGDKRLELWRCSVLQKVRAQVQVLPDSLLDKEDIKWVKKTNSSGWRKEYFTQSFRGTGWRTSSKGVNLPRFPLRLPLKAAANGTEWLS
jgi:hypothetical protein